MILNYAFAQKLLIYWELQISTIHKKNSFFSKYIISKSDFEMRKVLLKKTHDNDLIHDPNDLVQIWQFHMTIAKKISSNY
jgi:hypothetical protein